MSVILSKIERIKKASELLELKERIEKVIDVMKRNQIREVKVYYPGVQLQDGNNSISLPPAINKKMSNCMRDFLEDTQIKIVDEIDSLIN